MKVFELKETFFKRWTKRILLEIIVTNDGKSCHKTRWNDEHKPTMTSQNQMKNDPNEFEKEKIQLTCKHWICSTMNYSPLACKYWICHTLHFFSFTSKQRFCIYKTLLASTENVDNCFQLLATMGINPNP